MKLTADKKALAGAVKEAARFTPRLNFLPILEHLLVEATAGAVTVYATDTEMGRLTRVEADVGTEGRVVVPAALASVLGGAGGEKVELRSTKTLLKVSSEEASWQLRLGPVDDYPALPEPAEGAKVPITDWSRVRAVAGFASRADTRPQLMAVRLEGGTAAATDSYRLAYAQASTEEAHAPANIPARAIAALSADATALELSERTARAEVGDGWWWTRLIEGEYVKWRQLVDRGQPSCRLSIAADALDTAVARAVLVGKDEWPVWLTPETNHVTVSRREGSEDVFTEQIALSEGDLPAEPYAIALSPGYLRSVLRPVSRVTLHATDPHKVVLFEGDDWWQGALMPVRT